MQYPAFDYVSPRWPEAKELVRQYVVFAHILRTKVAYLTSLWSQVSSYLVSIPVAAPNPAISMILGRRLAEVGNLSVEEVFSIKQRVWSFLIEKNPQAWFQCSADSVGKIGPRRKFKSKVLGPFQVGACVICVKPPLKNRKLIVECVFTEVLDEAIVKAFMLNPDLHHLVSDKAGERHIAGIWFTYWPFVAPAYPHPAHVRGSVLFSIA